MPQTNVVFFCNIDGSCPFLHWFNLLSIEVQDKCIVRLERLAEKGHELRRPEADLLRNGIYELRASRAGVHYRILYFFHENDAVIWNGIIKESKVPDIEIQRALQAKALYVTNPRTYTYAENHESQ